MREDKNRIMDVLEGIQEKAWKSRDREMNSRRYSALFFTAALIFLLTQVEVLYSISSTNTSTTNLTVWDDSDSMTVYVNISQFFANYTNHTSGEPINGSGAWCEFSINKTGDWTESIKMKFNPSTELYELIADGDYTGMLESGEGWVLKEGHTATIPAGLYSYNITCRSDSGYSNLSTTDAVNVSEYPTSVDIFDQENDSETHPLSNDPEVWVNENTYFYANYTRYSEGIKEVLWSVNTGSNVYSVEAGDINNNNEIEIVVGRSSGDVLVYNSTGSLIDSNTDFSSWGHYDLKISDLDNDGEKEIIYSDMDLKILNSSLDMIYNTGDVSAIQSIEIGDINNDGYKEIIVGRMWGPNELQVYNYTLGNLWNHDFGSTVYYHAIDLADINNDGVLDVIVGSYGNRRLLTTKLDSCKIRFNDTGVWRTMQYDSSNGICYYNRTFSQTGRYTWNISCSRTLFESTEFSSDLNVSIDTYPPTYNSTSISNQFPERGDNVSFNALWTDMSLLDSWIFSWNASGPWVNDSSINFSGTPGWSNQSKIIPSNLKDGETVGWRIYARDEAGNYNHTEGSFTIQNLKPALQQPENNTISTDLTPSLNWNTALVSDSNFANYTIEVSSDELFSYVNYTYNTFNRTESNYSVTSSWTSDTTWYWHVTAYDEAGNSNTSTTYTYTTDTTNPLITNPIPEDNGFITNTSSVLFQVNLTEMNINHSINVTLYYRRQGVGNYLNDTLACYNNPPNHVCNKTLDISSLITDGDTLEYFFNTTDLAGLRGEYGNTSSPLTADIDMSYPSNPSNVAFQADPTLYFDNDGTLIVEWDTASDANGIKEYRIYVSVNGGAYTFNGTNTSPLQYTFNGADGFNYSVNVTATIPGDVCLRIQKPDGGWKEKVECKPYNNSGSWQPISFNRIHVWHLVDEELGLAHYQFKFYEGDDCRGESEIFPGPELIEEQFTTDLLVDPEKGTNTTWFNFNTNAKWLFDTNVTKDVPITLQVSPDREADDADWINMTNKTYENVTSGEPIPIDFNVSIDSSDIPPSQKKNLTSKWVNKTIYWRVKGLIYNSTLNQTKWDIGLNCSNRSFSEKGWWNDAFNFSVNLSAKVNGSVELQLKTVKDGKVYTFDNRTYNKRPNSQLFNWTINLRDKRDEEYEGKTEYSFIFHYNNIIDECDWEDGPYLYKRLKIRFINSSVTPSKGIYYDENGILQKYFKNRNTLFNYTINISANKNTSIKPVIIDPRGNNRTIEDAKNYSDGNEIKELNWTIEAFKPERLCLGMWNYTFIYYNTTKNNYVGGWEEYEKQFEGPELVAVFKDFKIEPEELPLLYSETCNVTVSVNGSEDLNITLELCNSTVCKPIENGTKTYNMSEGEQQMVWKDIKPWKMFKSSDKLFFNFNITGVPSIGEEPDGFTMEPSAREPKVNPIRGHWDTSFNYSVEIRFDKEIEVELWVSLKDGEHYYKRKELYPGSGDWERIYWNAVVPFGDEKRTSRFMFKWNETDFLKEREKGNLKKVEGHGPIIDEYPPTFVKFRNGTVSKEEATYKDELNYSVEVNATKYVRIELLVQGPRINPEWGSMYNYSYNNIGGWQKLTWNKTKPFSKNVFKGGRSDFQFIAHHEGSGVDFPSSVYHGPDLKPLIELKPRVDPPSGKYDTLFNYIVELVNVKYINISDVKRNIKLVVCTPADEEIFFENPVFENSIGKWSIKPFKNDSKCSGTAHYYFKYDGDETDKYDGPNINITGPTPSPTPAPHRGGGGGGGGSSYKPYIIYEKAIVEPDPVSIRGVRENKSLNYSVVVDKDKTLILAIYNLSSNEWEEKGKGKKSELKDRKWKHKWNVNLTLDKNWEGKTCRYRFYPEGQQKYTSQVYYGPEIKIKVSLTDIMEDIGISDKPLEEPEIECEVTPKEGGWFKKFTYSAEIKHPDRANMTLLLFVYKPGSGEWKPVPWRKDRYNPIIRSSDYDEDKSNIATLSWTVEKKDVFDEGDAGKSSKFYIWYWDGYNEYNESKGSFDGPELLVNHEPEFVIALKPKPEYGSTHTVYEYVFDLSDPENDTVYGWLTITDPLGEDHVIESAGKEGSIQFRVGPGRGIFTEDKLREYLNKTNETIFRSRYRLEYWDECMNVLRKTNSTDWFVGPNVSLVKVENKTPKVEPGRGKYADEFEYEVGFYSSKDNTFWLNLTIYDPSSPDHAHQSLSTTLRVDADTTNYTSWKIAPNVFGPDDFGKNASYTIEWKDEVGNRGIITGSDPYIERAVPLLSHELPFVPISMVIAPLAAFGISLILVLSRFWDRLREWLGI